MFNINDYISIGQNAMVRKLVEERDSTEEYSPNLSGLLATPVCIRMAIQAAIETIDPYLPKDFVSVGISTRFVHTAPTSVGMTVTLRTSIVAIEENAVLFDIRAWDEQGDIGHGQHKRLAISIDELKDKVSLRTRFQKNKRLI